MPEKKTKAQAAIGKIKVTQLKSHIGRKPDQRQTLIGLGLNKLHSTNILENTAAVRGMVNKVKHLLHVEIE